MTPADVQRLIERYGESVTLRRGTVEPYTDVAVKARVAGFEPKDLVGDIKQGDRQVVIGNGEIAAASWPGPPLRGDRLLIGGLPFTITAVDTRKIGDEIAGHWLVVRGQ